MTLLAPLEPKRLTPSEYQAIQMADATFGALTGSRPMRPGWFAALDTHNPWARPGLIAAIDRSKPVDGPNAHRRAQDEAGR